MSAAAVADPPSPLALWHSRWSTLASVILGVLGAALILWVTPEGIGVSNSDSVNYIKAAQSLIAGEGLRGFDGGEFVRWPPLFPALIALPMLGGLSGPDSARLVNALVYGLIVIASGVLFRQVLQSAALAVLGTIGVVVAWPLFLGAYFAFAETLFILLTILFFLALWPLAQRPSGRRLLVVAGIAALLCLQRYLGVAFVAAGGLVIVLLAQGITTAQRLRYAVGFGAVALLPLALWGLRNYGLVGSVAGGGWASEQQRMHQVPAIGLGWLWPDAAPVAVTDDPVAGAILTVGFALVLGVAAAGVAAWQRAGRVTGQTLAQTPTAPIALTFPVYSIVFAILADNLQISLNDRVLSPAYIPMMTLVLVLIDGLMTWLNRRAGRWAAAVPLALVALWLARPVARMAREAETLRRDFTALDFNHPNWQQDALIGWLNANAVDGPLYSNAALSVALLTDDFVRIAPVNLDGWDERTPPLYLAWYRDVDVNGCYHAKSTRLCFNTDYAIDDLRQRFDVEPLIETEGGGIYRLTGGEEPAE